ncbi:helix-turn-helix transcriptional regulator [Streptomyces radicis]|uniref:Helix-turn-helix transcriptional regulator n=2 Tax=Streptomyces radicis TaxID=1750517 RepID=A0A3A9WKY7_9ACTN|nr:helix-turn-helix transcriptional regulator [Streptomyces radicis]RKN21559.1 helix-turn-helix transcriptional regulator [Streptomyces radicis]
MSRNNTYSPRNRMPSRHLASPVPPSLPTRPEARAAPPLLGRDRQWQLVQRLLDAARSAPRRGGVLLVEGLPGTGRSRLLNDAAALAARGGFSAAHAAADELRRAMPLAPLAAALGQGPGGGPQSTGAGPSAPQGGGPPGNAALIERLSARVDELLRSGPVAVVLDDLHWADAVTLAAVRALVTRFAAQPVVWLLARCTGEGGSTVERLFTVLRESEGAELLPLTPLAPRAVAELTAQRLGAEPAAELLAYVEGADGNPAALVALLDGLAEERRVQIVDGRARLARCPSGGLPPHGFGALVRRRMEPFHPTTRLLLDVAAVLGRASTPDDMARMLGETPAAVLPALREALASRMVVCEEDAIAFRHELVRHALLATIPGPLRGALHRQAADMILGRDGGVQRAAAHLVHGARRGDGQAVEVLRAAASAVAAAEPRAAAELALRALEISRPEDAARPRLFRVAVEALTRVGPLPRAVALAREALAGPLPADQATALRHGLSRALLLAGRAAETAPQDPPPADLPEEALVADLHGLAALDVSAAARRAREETERRAAASSGLLGVLATTHWCAGRVGEALRVARAAVARAEDEAPGPGTSPVPPRLLLASMLTQLRQTAEATATVELLAAEIEADGTPVLRGAPMILNACLALARGAPDAAATEATEGLAAAEETGMALLSSLGGRVLAEVALRRGDLAAADGHVERLAGRVAEQRAESDEARALTALCGWLAARLAAARGDLTALATALRTVHGDRRALRRLLVAEPAAAAWLVRAALDAGDRETAGATAGLAQGLASDNAEVPSLAAAAMHASGLYERDRWALRRAGEEHQDPWARASAAEDLGCLPGGDREAAVDALDRAMSGYARLGAERDEARVRRRLRRLGVRRRHWKHAHRPTSGWASLTATERRVADLVAQGMTNRQAAAQLFLSPHTVGFHLRQIFRKLGIQSRIELVRLHADAVEGPRGAA